MTKEVLSQYSDLQEEIKEVRKKIAKLQDDLKKIESGESVIDTVSGAWVAHSTSKSRVYHTLNTDASARYCTQE